MKTVAELAKELNISTQAIYKKINKSLKAELSSHVKTVNGQRVVDEQGIIIIKTSLQPVLQADNQTTVNSAKTEGLQPLTTEIMVENHSLFQKQPYNGKPNKYAPFNGLQPIATAKAYIYKFQNDDGEVLYIGKTKNLYERINMNHFAGVGHLPDECYLETKYVEYTTVKDTENPTDKENFYIHKYAPKYNTVIKHEPLDVNYNDEWITFDFYKNTEAFFKKYMRAIKSTEEIKRLKEENAQLRKDIALQFSTQKEELDFLRTNFALAQDELNKEREHSRQQADRLANLAEQLAELSRNNQILLGAEQSRTNPALLMGGNEAEQSEQDEAPPLKKKSFWSLFKKS